MKKRDQKLPCSFSLKHDIDPDDVSGEFAPEVLQRLRIGDWEDFNLRHLRAGFISINDYHDRHAAKSPRGYNDARCVELRRCLHALTDVFAAGYLKAGPKSFKAALETYRERSSKPLTAIDASLDQAFYHALLRVQDSSSHALGS